MARRVVAISLVLVLASAAACFASAQSEPTSGKPAAAPAKGGTVEFWWYDKTREAPINELVRRFKEASGINVTMQGFPGWGDMYTKEMLGVASGNPPDTAIEKPMNMPDLASRGALVPLDDYISKAKLDRSIWFDVNIGYDATWDNKTYALPFWSASQGFFINTELYKKAGFDPNDPPKTWAQMVERATKMTNEAQGVYGLMLEDFKSPNVYHMLAVQNGAELLNADQTKCLIDSPQAVEAMQFMYDLVFKYKVSPGPGIASNDLLYNNKVAMAYHQNVTVANVATFAPDVKFVSTLTPKGPVNAKVIEMGSSLDMFAGGKNHDGAFELIKYLSTNKDAQFYWSKETAMLPALRSVMSDPYFATPTLSGFQKIAEGQLFIPRPVMPGSSQIYNTVTTAVQEVMTGKKLPKQALTDARVKIDDILKSTKK